MPSTNNERATAFEAKKESLAKEFQRTLFVIRNAYPVGTENRNSVWSLLDTINLYQKNLFNSITAAEGDEKPIVGALKTFNKTCSAEIEKSRLKPTLLKQLTASLKGFINKIGKLFGVTLFERYAEDLRGSSTAPEVNMKRSINFLEKAIKAMESTIESSFKP